MPAAFCWVNLEEKVPLGRPRHRWGDKNFITGLKEGRWEGMNWIYLAGDRDWWKAFVNTDRKLWDTM
jgi:hypothetical protein